MGSEINEEAHREPRIWRFLQWMAAIAAIAVVEVVRSSMYGLANKSYKQKPQKHVYIMLMLTELVICTKLARISNGCTSWK